jgi:RimJ/RimL family protein N-acetyltransferase
MIPTLQTERLLLREMRESDLDAFASFMADEDVVRYLSGVTMTRDEAWRSIATGLGHWHLRGYGTWAVERKSDGAFMGRVGLINPEG